MSRRYCSGCADLRSKVGEPLPWCKVKRLCKMVDPGLVLRYPGESLEQYAERGRHIEMGYVRAAAALSLRSFPTRGLELLDLAIEMHEITFAAGDPTVAGKVRTGEISFGRGGNQLHGAPADEIWDRMAKFPIRCLPQGREKAARWGADFLQRFFLVHPFVDGNGRVGRLLMTRAIEQSGMLAIYETQDRGSRKYLHALEYAHRHAPHVGRFSHGGDYLRWLAEWLLERVHEVALEEDEPP